jgi:hypothetical protein
MTPEIKNPVRVGMNPQVPQGAAIVVYPDYTIRLCDPDSGLGTELPDGTTVWMHPVTHQEIVALLTAANAVATVQ